MSYVINKPESFLDYLIKETWENNIKWEKSNFEYGDKFESEINIEKTKKFFKLEVFDMKKSSFLKIEFYTKPHDKIKFENIKRKRYIKINSLILAIRNNLIINDIINEN